MPIYAVEYTYGPDRATQDAHRGEHRAFLARLAEDGVLLGSGPLLDTDPARALMVLRAPSAEGARDALVADPFQQLGQVANIAVTQWNPLIGPAFATWL